MKGMLVALALLLITIVTWRCSHGEARPPAQAHIKEISDVGDGWMTGHVYRVTLDGGGCWLVYTPPGEKGATLLGECEVVRR